MGFGDLSPSCSEAFRRPTAAKRRLLGRRWVFSILGKYHAVSMTNYWKDRDYHRRFAGLIQR